jgi:hypothetical protein
VASFIRSILQIVLGFALGFAAATYYLPAARSGGGSGVAPKPVAQKPGTGNATAAAGGDADASSTLFGRRGGQSSAGTTTQPARETPVAVVEPERVDPTPVAEPQPEPAKEPAVAVAEEPVDFRELCIKPAAWPPIITLNKEINAQVMQGEEVIAEIPLSAGEKLQVSKVFGDATAEVRAKGAKFIVKAADTDLAALARGRLAEISGRVRAPTPVAPTPEPAPATKVSTKEPAPEPPPARSDDLDSKMRSLFGTPQRK